MHKKIRVWKEGFPPIADKKATILILGTMPGEESLRKQEYYGNPRNTFWKIMATLFEFEHEEIYEERVKRLKINHIALWDVMQACERLGSLDSAIIDNTIAENDITNNIFSIVSNFHIVNTFSDEFVWIYIFFS